MTYEESRVLLPLFAGLGLDIWPHDDPFYGWYYSWYGRESGDGVGPYTSTLEAALSDSELAVTSSAWPWGCDDGEGVTTWG